MQRILLVSILAVLLGGFFAPLLAADNNADRNQDNSFVKFRGGIGVVPISNVAVDANNAVTVTRNMVRGVNSPGQIWRIEDLDARIKSNGDSGSPWRTPRACLNFFPGYPIEQYFRR